MTAADILAELEELTRSASTPDGFYTNKELAAVLGIGKVAMAKRLELAKRAGRLEVVFVQREAIDGRPLRSPAYRVLPVKPA
jgi:hypothetical protein